jgi:hypothetical protein
VEREAEECRFLRARITQARQLLAEAQARSRLLHQQNMVLVTDIRSRFLVLGAVRRILPCP